MGGRRIVGLKSRVGQEVALAEGAKWIKLNNAGIEAEKAQRRRHSVGRCGTTRKIKDGARQRQKWELPKVLNLAKDSSEHLK